MLDFCEGLLYAFAAPNDCPVSVKMSKNSSAICYYFYTQIRANYYMILIPNPECFGHFGRIPLLFTTNLRVIWLKFAQDLGAKNTEKRRESKTSDGRCRHHHRQSIPRAGQRLWWAMFKIHMIWTIKSSLGFFWVQVKGWFIIFPNLC